MRARSSLAFAVLVAGLWAGTARADIFAQEGPDGTPSYTDAPLSADYRLVIRDPTPPRLEKAPEPRWREVAHREATNRRLDPLLVKAVIQVESGEDPGATSRKGAKGLMQLMPGTAQHLGVDDPYEPSANVRGGVQYLSQMYQRFGRIDLALAAYNAGPKAVERHRGIPPYRETRNYVARVLEAYRKLSTESAGSGLDSGGGGVDNRVAFAERE